MNNFSCKVATRDELLKRWEYLIKIHPGNNDWVRYKENAVRNYDNGSTISYLGFLDDQIICEATAFREYIKTVIEYETSEDDDSKQEDVILFYKKRM